MKIFWATITAFISGGLFAAGLVIGGMTQPAKVIGFLDLFGNWDPSLAFVMAGAISIYLPLYRYLLKTQTPIFASKYFTPTNKQIDLKLFIGSVLFGVGWGIAGYCPGPALASLLTSIFHLSIFVGLMLLGSKIGVYVKARI